MEKSTFIEILQELENQWADLNDALDDSALAGKQRSEQMVAYEGKESLY